MKKGKSKAPAIAVIVAVIALIGIIGSTGDDEDTSKKETDLNEIKTVETQGKEEKPETEPTAKEPETPPAPPVEAETAETTMKDLVLVDEAGVKITAKSIDYSGWMGPELKLLIENTNDHSITVQARDVSVNGYMVDHTMSADVSAGKKANSSVTFQNNSLETAGISVISDIELSFHVYGESLAVTHLDTDLINITANQSSEQDHLYEDKGVLVYDKNNIKIRALGTEDESVLGKSVYFYIHNQSDTPITVQTREDSVNGFMVSASCSIDVTPGKRAIDNVTIYQSSLDENGIEKINEYEFYFHIYGSSLFDTIDQSDAITLTFS